MTAHLHGEFVDGCYRCDLSRDEVTDKRVITIRLPFSSPPLRSNDRLHWAAKANRTRIIRDAVAWAVSLHPPKAAIDYPVTVTIVWQVTDRRTRDAGSVAPTGKAAIDGLVDAGVLARDSRDVVVQERYEVRTGPTKAMWVEIEAVTDPEQAREGVSVVRRATNPPPGTVAPPTAPAEAP